MYLFAYVELFPFDCFSSQPDMSLGNICLPMKSYFPLTVLAHKLSRDALYVDWENQSYLSIDRQGRPALQEIVNTSHYSGAINY